MLDGSTQNSTRYRADEPDAGYLYQVDQKRFGCFYAHAAHNGYGGYFFADVDVDGACHANAAQ
jgi:hypothetical protein